VNTAVNLRLEVFAAVTVTSVPRMWCYVICGILTDVSGRSITSFFRVAEQQVVILVA
jgi:hypothetical protein